MATKQKSITIDDETREILDYAKEKFGVNASDLFRVLIREYKNRGYKVSRSVTVKPIPPMDEGEAEAVRAELDANED